MKGERAASIELRAVEVIARRQEILRQISLSVLPGELFVLLGAAGSGKSALLRSIAGLDPVSSGEIWLNDRQITRTPARRRPVALMFQSFPLWPHMTVAGNVEFALRRVGMPRGARHARAGRELAFVGLAEFARHLPSQLSASRRQRAALARTLAADARVNLLDEPFSAQDAGLRERLLRGLRRRQQLDGVTTLLSTQDRVEAMRVADHMAIIHEGELQQVGTPMELYDAPCNRHVAACTGSVNLLDGAVEYAGDQPLFHTHNGMVIPLFDHPLKRARTGAAMFRPQDLHIIRKDEAPFGDQIRFTGHIEQTEFLGDRRRYGIDLFGTTLWLELPHADDRPALQIGESVVVGLDPTRVRILES
jgi:ABC-type Fe3+/spermidine/putrescine transport system ATPase subunit